MSDLTLVLSPSRGGRTRRLCELLQAAGQEHLTRSLLLVPNARQCDQVDRMLLDEGWGWVRTKSYQQIKQTRGVHWAAIGLDDPYGRWDQWLGQNGLQATHVAMVAQIPSLTEVTVSRTAMEATA